MKNMRIRARMLVIVAFGALGVLATAAFGLANLQDELLNDRKLKTENLVEVAYTAIKRYHDMEVSGAMTREDAQAAAKEAVRSLKYDLFKDDKGQLNGNYFWINDMHPTILMHGAKSSLDGKDASGIKDSNGTLLFQEFVKVVRADGEGFVPYLWAKPGKEEPQEKLSFVKGFGPWGWIVGSGIYIDDVSEIFMAELYVIIGVAIATLIIIGFVSIIIANGIANPIGSITGNMRRIAEGDLEVTVEHANEKSEIGDLAGVMQTFLENSKKMEDLRVEQEQAKARSDEQRRASMLQMAEQFESQVGTIVDDVATAANTMNGTATDLSNQADETERQSSAVAVGAEQTSGNVQTVASATEELSSSVGEISRQVGQSAQIAQSAATESQRTQQQVQELAEAASKIGEVVNLITDIAEQTNLLALNATIEAARAGDAGKGFAVVASEVKNLANQTARATEEIASQIASIQTATTDAVGAISGIAETISQINEIASAIASAVEEQGAATQEIARNVEQAASGTQEVNANIAVVSTAAHQTKTTAQSMTDAASHLTEESQHLKSAVDQFLSEIRAA